jgi:hypothetical protein
MTAPSSVQFPGPFVIDELTVEGAVVDLGYRLGDLHFVERVEFPVELPDTPELRAALKALHLVAGVSYYKCGVPTPIHTPALTAAERALVEALYDKGLRELAYRNGLAMPLPVELVEADAEELLRGDPTPASATAPVGRGALIPVGGGKDSALVGDLVPDGQLMSVNPVGAHEALARRLGRPLRAVRRTMDPGLRTAVEAGAINGHVPVTAINSAVAVVLAVALGLRDVLMGLERSASEPTLVTDDGVEVNHQFSKSAEAESLLRAVFAPTGVRYLSILRPMTELAIGGAVADRGLTDSIVSCNRAFTVWSGNESSRTQRPCGECAKCLFTALMLAPSSDPGEVRAHFGRDLLDEPALLEEVRALWSSEKPFDCVGERHESAAAVVMLSRLAEWRDQAVPRELAAEAEGVLDEVGTGPERYLELDGTDELPEEYRELIASFAEPLSDVGERLDET